ncbi:aldo/keto reductase [Actinomadura chibensis]|uniref:Aldo/keto reductase n=1 Tax=Actinomadura chibensis TaxID=392828 RepID=A0A5D0NWC1_9ACTN|nr:aldo/keto reductase [Actinomadura chibensis]TYB48529.1 aldo/keto reductase [Actinomadura chibensis]
MEYRQLGTSGLRVPALSFGTATFGGRGDLFGAWGDTGADAARRLVDICLDAGVTMFDTADSYSAGASEEVLGQAIKGRRDQVMLSTKVGLPTGEDRPAAGSARQRLTKACEDALRRLGTDHVDLFQLHAFDAGTPIEEVLAILDDLIRAGKTRHVGVSNFSGWQLMKSLAIADRDGRPRYAAHQVYYSLIGRDFEWELMPLALDQGVGTIVWSPLGWGRLTGRLRRGRPLPARSRLHRTAKYGPPVDDERLFTVVEALDEIGAETGKSASQIAINWLLQRPTVSSVIIGARDEAQLRENLGAMAWTLSPEHVSRLDAASEVIAPYPRFLSQLQEGFARLDPPPIARAAHRPAP